MGVSSTQHHHSVILLWNGPALILSLFQIIFAQKYDYVCRYWQQTWLYKKCVKKTKDPYLGPKFCGPSKFWPKGPQGPLIFLAYFNSWVNHTRPRTYRASWQGVQVSILCKWHVGWNYTYIIYLYRALFLQKGLSANWSDMFASTPSPFLNFILFFSENQWVTKATSQSNKKAPRPTMC